MILSLPILETKRLILRKLKETDRFDLFLIRGNESLNRHIDVQIEQDSEQTLKFINQINVGIEDSKWLLWGVEEKESHKLIGTVSLWHFEDQFSKCEIGYVTNLDFQGKGFTKEYIERILEYGFQKLHLSEISAYTEQHNENSNALLQKLGFTYVKTIQENGFHKKRIFEMNVYKKNHC